MKILHFLPWRDTPCGVARGPRLPGRFSGRKGVALVLVLSFLVLITVLVVTFFSSVSTELSGATSYASEANSKQLGDSAVQLVMGAIKQATTSGSNVAWASQPGMIRTYGNGSGGASNAALANYKLYSSDQMVVSGTFDPSGEVDAQWHKKPALYTDLNAPVVSGGTLSFPIVDGNVTAMSVGGSNVYTYASGTAAAVEGFYTTPPESFTSGAALSATNNPVPMPVKWIYILRDGTLTVPSDATATTADFKNSKNPPTKDNPITGRIAFWTDDECAKININTASEGVYMDTPRVGTVPEINLANNQPAQSEFYRYPGHPSMTSLSTVFGSWMPLPPGGTPANAYAGLTAANYAQYLKPYYDLAPRVVNGPGGTAAASATLVPDKDRLYASIDELLFSPASSGGARVPNKNGSGVAFTRQQIEQSKFFITAGSRAPDVNLFGGPRVCVWPIHATNDAAHRTTLDNLITFCSTQNGNGYYFQRADSTSPVNDISITRNQELLRYLRGLADKPIPGFSASSAETFNAKYNAGSANDMDQIFTEIFDYIRSTNTCDSALSASGWFTKTVPGKPTLASNEVVPSYDSTTNTKGFGRFLSPSQASLLFIATADGDWNAAHPAYFQTGTSAGPVFPDGYTDLNVGAGKIGMKAALLLDVYDVANGYPAMTSNTANYTFVVSGLGSLGLNIPDTVTLRLGPSPALYGRTYGGGYGPAHLYIPIAGILKGSTPTPVPVSTTQLVLDKSSGAFAFGGGTVKVEVHYKDATGKDNIIQTVNFPFPPGSFPLPKLVNSDLVYSGTNAAAPDYLSVSQTPWSIPAADGTSRPITSSTATVRLSPGDVLKGEPGKPFPWVVPLMPKGFQFWVNASLTYPQLDFTKFSDRLNINNNSLTSTPNLYSQTGAASGGVWGIYHGYSTITPYDTVRSVDSVSGDIRISAGRKEVNVGDGVFGPHPYYNNLAQSLAHSHVHGDGTPLYGATRGVLAPGLKGPTTLMSPYFGWMTNWGAFWSSYTLYYAPLGKTPFPGYDGIPGMQANGPLNPGKLRTSVFNGVACPNWGPIVTGTDPGGGMNQLANIFTLEPQARSIDGVAAGYAPASPTTSFTDWADAPSPKVPGDWDNGVANIKDGPYINKPDEGALTATVGQSPYYDWAQAANVATAAMFSPNRQIPSAAMFGSLPTGVKANKPWQTLLFRPDPGPGHKGAKAPQDHLLLDLFTMPVVEPYPISEPLSTAGRINMNYQIVPFTYINRDTGIRAVLKGERILAIPNASSGGGSTAAAGIKPYKTYYSTDTVGTNNSSAPKYMRYDLRYDINADETLKGFRARFDANDLFRSPSEICTLDLIPNDTDYSTAFQGQYKPKYSADGSAMRLYWSEHALTGDNSRERPYADIYPRLTTKTNTFTVHFRVQTLTKAKGSRPDLWTEGRDSVSSEYRGAQTIERYVDPGDSRLKDYASGSQEPLDVLYKFRVLSAKRFAP